MKLKKILSGMFIVALGVTSCTSEMPVDNQGEDGVSALSVVLSVGDQVTKTIDDPAGGSYGIATTKEITINDFHVAIFDGTSNQRIDAMNQVKQGFKMRLSPTMGKNIPAIKLILRMSQQEIMNLFMQWL